MDSEIRLETLVEAYALDMVDKKGLDLRPLIVLIYELFFAGTETTSTSLQWVFACMAAHPEIQESFRRNRFSRWERKVDIQFF